MNTPGPIALIGSGETAHVGGQVFEMLARELPAPLHISVLETPAGFETNASRVAGRVADFLHTRLQNYRPEIDLIAARKKGTRFSPDNPEIVDALYDSQVIFFGPGSPTYTVRQLEDSLAWDIIQARQRLGAALVLASAATIAVGRQALPVYEIYKVGEDPLWKPGLDLLAAYQLKLVMVPHWNNHEGGEDVDTSRCFIGQERFKLLKAQVAEESTIVGIDEQTALMLDFAKQECTVQGAGQVHLLRGDQREDYASGGKFPMQRLGDYRAPEKPELGLSEAVWREAKRNQREDRPAASTEVPPLVTRLVEQRQSARREKNFKLADQLRKQIQQEGWQVSDQPDGPQLSPLEK